MQSIRERRDQRIIDNLLVLTEDVILNKSNNRYRLAAAVVKRNKVLGSGVNNYKKTHPAQAKYRTHDLAVYPCAETSALLNAKKRVGDDGLKGATIYVVRAKWTDPSRSTLSQGLAKPCEGCIKRIKEAGIAKIVYTQNDHGFVCEEVAYD